MNQQQSENDQKKINKFYKQNPIGQRRAQLLRKKLHRNMCSFFYPFKQYYHQYRISYIFPPKPTYVQKQQFQEKMIMSSPKQCEYLRGATNNYFQEQLIQSLINQQERNRGLMENIQNRSLYVDELLIYASGWSIESIHLQLGKHKTQQNINEGFNSIKTFSQEFPEPVMQLILFSSSSIIIRCRHWIFLYDIQLKEQIGKIRLRQEITSIAKYGDKNCLLISTFKQNFYYLYQWDLNKNSLNELKKTQCFWPIHSTIYLNSRQFILGFYNKITIEDVRCPHSETLRRVDQIGNNRFCNISKVFSKKNEIVISRSKFIDVFDIRNPQMSLLSVRHKCQQSPPSCLINLWWEQPIMIAYSPFKMGSAILLNLNTPQDIKQQSKNNLYKRNQNKPMLLFDSGKYFKGLYVKSICGIVNQDILKLIHIDSSDGICLEQLKKNKRLEDNIIHIRPSNVKQDIINYPEQPYKKWIQFKQVQPYLTLQKHQLDSIQADQPHFIDNQSEIFKRVNNYCSLDSFRNRLHQVSKNQDKEYKNTKEGKQIDTYVSSLVQTEQNQTWTQILKYASKTKSNQEKITQQLLYFMEKTWQI